MIYGLPILVLVAAGLTILVGRRRTRPPGEPGFPFVYVNLDGSARELSPDERAYVSKDHHGADSGRPYIKSSYEELDGWGNLSGFLPRRHLPSGMDILPVHPDYDARAAADPFDPIELERASGRSIISNSDGSITSAPDPDENPEVAFERARQAYLDGVRERERMARADEPAQ